MKFNEIDFIWECLLTSYQLINIYPSKTWMAFKLETLYDCLTEKTFKTLYDCLTVTGNMFHLPGRPDKRVA
jgi:hypothetical protein